MIVGIAGAILDACGSDTREDTGVGTGAKAGGGTKAGMGAKAGGGTKAGMLAPGMNGLGPVSTGGCRVRLWGVEMLGVGGMLFTEANLEDPAVGSIFGEFSKRFRKSLGSEAV